MTILMSFTGLAWVFVGGAVAGAALAAFVIFRTLRSIRLG